MKKVNAGRSGDYTFNAECPKCKHKMKFEVHENNVTLVDVGKINWAVVLAVAVVVGCLALYVVLMIQQDGAL